MITARGATGAIPTPLTLKRPHGRSWRGLDTIPKTPVGLVEMIRQVKVARDTARKGRTSRSSLSAP